MPRFLNVVYAMLTRYLSVEQRQELDARVWPSEEDDDQEETWGTGIEAEQSQNALLSLTAGD